MLEITRELVEHYLRATGWTFDPKGGGWWVGKDALGNEGRGFPASWLDATVLDIDVVIRITGHNKHLALLAFRLGLCAAAEYDVQEARRLIDTPSCFALQRVAEDKLRAAGIDPGAWESARKR